MKRICKIVSLLCAFGILLTLPVFAGGDNANLPETTSYPVHMETVVPIDENEVQPCGDICVDCGVGTMSRTYYSASDWSTYDYVDCECEGGYSPMQDALQERYVTVTYTCGNCGISDTYTTRYTRQVHYR